MRAIEIVFRKELLDGRRDRRAVMSAMMFPILAPAIVYFMLTAVINLRSQSEDKPIPIVGMEHAPALMQWLKEQGAQLEAFEGDAREAVKEKKRELVLIIPPDFSTKVSELRIAPVEIVQDGSRTDAQATVRRVTSLLNRYSTVIAQLRLIARGIAPELARPVIVQDIDVASKQQRTAAGLNFIPMYIILAAFVSGMGLAIDATAGERERKSLEPLLINPVERFQIIAGKWLAASVFASIGMILTAVLCIVAMMQVPLEEVGMSFHVSIGQIIAIIAGTFPVAFLATSLQLTFGLFAKSFKDAQSYMGLLVFLPMAPGMFTLFNPIATKEWMFLVPVLGQQLLLVDLLGGKDIPPIAYVFSIVSCLVIGFALVLVAARLLRRESIITS